MKLFLPACRPEEADFIAEYPLPFPAEGTELEGEEALFAHMTWKERLSPRIPEKELRPAFHFAPAHGWLNDPNGCYFRDGEWHLYFQHNPLASVWSNMHWGHAVSRDLLHWEERDIALYPDAEGTMYSGSAVIDHENCAGFGRDKVLLYYTNCSYDNQGTQCLAVGDGDSFRKIKGNPLIACLSGKCDRDPNLAFDPAAKVWRMAIFSGAENKPDFLLFASDDLLHWEKTDTYEIPGGGECPGIRLMKDTVSGEKKWVFTEANGLFRIGSVSSGGKVSFETDPEFFVAGDAYAGQFFYDAPEGRSVFISWLKIPHLSFSTWCGCMTLPLDVRLENKRLKCRPAVSVPSEDFSAERKTVLRGKNREICFDPEQGTISDGTKSWRVQEPGEPFAGRIVRDHAVLEYFDARERYAAAFFFRDIIR